VRTTDKITGGFRSRTCLSGTKLANDILCRPGRNGPESAAKAIDVHGWRQRRRPDDSAEMAGNRQLILESGRRRSDPLLEGGRTASIHAEVNGGAMAPEIFTSTANGSRVRFVPSARGPVQPRHREHTRTIVHQRRWTVERRQLKHRGNGLAGMIKIKITTELHWGVTATDTITGRSTEQ